MGTRSQVDMPEEVACSLPFLLPPSLFECAPAYRHAVRLSVAERPSRPLGCRRGGLSRLEGAPRGGGPGERWLHARQRPPCLKPARSGREAGGSGSEWARGRQAARAGGEARQPVGGVCLPSSFRRTYSFFFSRG